MKRLVSLLMVLSLAACGDRAPADTAAADPAPVVEAPATGIEPEEATDTIDAPATVETTDEALATGEASPAATEAPATTEAAPAPEAPAVATPTPAPTPPPATPDPANAPREGTDYTVLAEPQPTFGQGGIEVAEVFSYMCIHCKNLQPAIDRWKPTLPSDVRFIYVPGAFGGTSDTFARAFYAAEAMGVLDKVHVKLFTAVFDEKAFKSGSEDEVADWFGKHGGVDRDTFLSTMKSFAVTAKLNRARQFAARTDVQSTPTMIIAGKYNAVTTGDRGQEGLLRTIEWLVARERAEAAAN